MGTKISTETIAGHRIDVEVNSGGKFEMEYDDQEFTGDTKAEVVEKVKKAISRAKRQPAIDVTILERSRNPQTSWQRTRKSEVDETIALVDATLRGINPRTRQLLITWTDGEKEQLYYDQVIARRLTDDEKAEYLRLRVAIKDAAQAYETWKEGVIIKPRDHFNPDKDDKD